MRAADRFVRAVAWICLCVAAPAGCTKQIWIVQYPDFYEEGKIQSVAVWPFRSPGARGPSRAGHIIADGLATALMHNGTYKRVYNTNDLRTLLAAHDLRLLLEDEPSAIANKLKKVANVQAIITGSVITHSATSRSERRSRQVVYAYDKDGRPLYKPQWYTFTRNEANVSVTAALLRASDGSTIYALPGPATGRASAQGSPPRYDRNACLLSATNQVVWKLLERFAVIRKKIKLNPGKALRIASEIYDNKWTWKESFTVDDEKMYVVLALPPSCDRNKFRLVVVPRNSREEVAAQDIVWTKRYGSFGYPFSLKEIAKAGGGPGEYVVKFYSGPEPVMTRKFRIVP